MLPSRTSTSSAPQAQRRRRDSGGSPPESDIAASYARYSSDLQDESSIDQQQRRCLDAAAKNGHRILQEFEFADKAVSGTKLDRDGLSAMLDAARNGRFATLYFDCLSRLARELVITLPMIKELVHVCGVRIVSVSEGIDSTIAGWEFMALFRSYMHGEYLKTLRDAVLRGQEDAVLNSYSVGDWRFGYGSEPIRGSETTRRGRNAKPRMRYVIDEEQARWVRLIFKWFVNERRSLDWIARELTIRKAPKDHRATTDGWHHDYVKRVLRSRKYIGIWPWGVRKTVRNPLTGQLRQEDRSPEESAKFEREFPHLRLIEDDTFFRAQAMLDENELEYAKKRLPNGRLSGSTAGAARPRHLLQGLIVCGRCGRKFGKTGAGSYMNCPGSRFAGCACKTGLPRELAKRMILEAIGERLLRDEAWQRAVLDETLSAWRDRQQRQPDEQKEVERSLDDVDQRISRLVDAIEAARAGPEVRERLAERRQERVALPERLCRLKREEPGEVTPPTQEWVTEKLQELHRVITEEGSAAANALRSLIGSIVVTEVEQPNRRRKYFRGAFRMAVGGLLGDGGATGPEATTGNQAGVEMTLEFKESPPWAAVADEVKALFDARVKYKEIAKRLACPPSWTAKALAWWHEQRGLTSPDGRKLVGRLARQTLAEAVADEVMQFYRQELPIQEIAEKFGCDRNTVTDAVRHWHETQGLPVPDGRNRRKALNPRWHGSRPNTGEGPERAAS